MKSLHGFKSEIFTKKHGRLTLQREEESTFTKCDDLRKSWEATGQYKRVVCWDQTYGGRGNAPDRFFVLAFA